MTGNQIEFVGLEEKSIGPEHLKPGQWATDVQGDLWHMSGISLVLFMRQTGRIEVYTTDSIGGLFKIVKVLSSMKITLEPVNIKDEGSDE